MSGGDSNTSSKSRPILKFFRPAAEHLEPVVTFECDGDVLQLSTEEVQQVITLVNKRDRPIVRPRRPYLRRLFFPLPPSRAPGIPFSGIH